MIRNNILSKKKKKHIKKYIVHKHEAVLDEKNKDLKKITT